MSEESTERFFGTVVSFRDEKCFGFIRPDGGENDVFFHFSYLQMSGWKTVKPGTRVSFEIGHNHKGPMAVKIVVESPPPETKNQ